MMGRAVLRTCVGCRRVRDQRELVRLAVNPVEGLVVSPLSASKPPGRGAYVCPSLVCLQKAWHRKGFPRAFRREVPGLDEAAIRERFEAELRRRPIAG